MAGCIDIDQMKKFFIHPTSEHTSFWDDAFDVFNLKDNQTLITFPVSALFVYCLCHSHLYSKYSCSNLLLLVLCTCT